MHTYEVAVHPSVFYYVFESEVKLDEETLCEMARDNIMAGISLADLADDSLMNIEEI